MTMNKIRLIEKVHENVNKIANGHYSVVTLELFTDYCNELDGYVLCKHELTGCYTTWAINVYNGSLCFGHYGMNLPNAYKDFSERIKAAYPENEY